MTPQTTAAEKPKREKKPRAPKPKVPPTPQARRLREKLAALVERGVNGERTAAEAKLARLDARYDFTVPDPTATRDLFEGTFHPSTKAELIAKLADLHIENAVKSAIEARCGIRCLFRSGELYAEATPETARQLRTIAATVAGGFSELWDRMKAAPGICDGDKTNFIAGLWDGMLNEQRIGVALPTRPGRSKPVRGKKRALVAAGMAFHPYTVALHLGRQLCMCVPLDDITHGLESKIRGELEAAA